MECLKCHTPLTTIEETFFFVKGAQDVHLSIKPESICFVKNKNKIESIRESKKKVRVKCKTCGCNVGVELPFGPNGTNFHAFAVDKVKLCHRSLSKKDRWWNLYKEFSQIETRDVSNFFNVLTNNFETKNETIEDDINAKIVFPSLANLYDFEWATVSLQKKPRFYQIQAYVEALQRHLIVVIKTGAGKTLIASMFLGRMCALNPGKMGLMIVDRIPLVFQQGDAIQSDTNLRVARICGENKTDYKIKQLNNGHYDVLVITAGAIDEMLRRKLINVELFCAVVFDECHHMSGGHKYVNVLEWFTKNTPSEQPRILGLTASPVGGKTVLQFENQLDKFLRHFPNSTKIFFPPLPKQEQKTEMVKITLSRLQNEFSVVLYERINQLLRMISSSTGVGKLELREDFLNSYQVVGELRSLEGEYPNVPMLDKTLKKVFVLLNALEISIMMGIPMACEKIKSAIGDIFSASDDVILDLRKYLNVKVVSTRLSKLNSLLRSLKSQSKILIFSHTREVARELKRYLDKEHAELKTGIVVGHGGFDGMGWEGEQEDVLKAFRNGVFNILVCTSVLEEGLDVPTCDVVVRYTGVKSLVQFIQSRGRGRIENSRFIVYQSEVEATSGRDLQREEDMLRLVLRQKQSMHQCFSDMSKDIIKRIKEELPEKMKGADNPSLSLFEDIEGKSDFTFSVYIDALPDVNNKMLKEELSKNLEEYRNDVGFYVNRMELIDKKFSEETGVIRVLSENTITFLVGARCQNNDQPINERYSHFCRMFQFQLAVEGQVAKIWSRRQTKTSDTEGNPTINSSRFHLGNFIDRESAHIAQTFNLESCISFEPFKYMIIDFVFEEQHFRIKISFSSLSNFGLLSMNGDQTFTFCFTLLHPPIIVLVISELGEEIELRVTSPHPILQQFVENEALFLDFHMNHHYRFRNVFTSIKFFPAMIFDAKIKLKAERGRRMENPLAGNRNILWSLKCIKDSRKICIPEDLQNLIFNHIKKLPNHSNTKDEYQRNVCLIERVIERIHAGLDRYHYFSDFSKLYSNAYQVYCKLPVERQDLLDVPIPDHHYMVKRVIITPSKIVALPAVPTASNRILRIKEINQNKLIIVSFKEENFNKINDGFTRIRNVVENGIVINDIKYFYFCSTGSQLRSHKGYFIASRDYDQLLASRRMIVPHPEDFTSEAKYISRLGLYGTADKAAIDIKVEEINWLDDEKALNEDLTTDGAGKISFELARRVYEAISNPKVADDVGSISFEKPKKITKFVDFDVPSCFQIRYSGCKGILVCTDRNDDDLQGKELAMRKSMKKFNNADTQLSVVSVSKFLELNLNRELITLLSCIKCNWPLANVLMRYQENELQKYANMFIDQTTARIELSMFLPKRQMETLKLSGFELLEERYWFKLLQGVYRLNTSNIRKKTWIPIQSGCSLIGVPDPCNVLHDNEIFVQLCREDEKDVILEEAVLMFRNPCLHPGDIRRVQCVKRLELNHLYNVVVLPSTGCSFSLASSCSGGDLDGDKFSIIWDQNLVPPEQFIYKPCDYSALSKPTTQLAEVDVTEQASLARFFIDVMQNDSLGRVATKHLALCDILDDGARDPLAIELSKSQSMAVDYPKTGIPVTVPKEALGKVDEHGFPDFMEKSDTYVSKKILGDLYRRCKSVTCDFDLMSKRNEIKMLMNMNLLIEGHEQYLEDAANVYISYSHDMNNLMAKFQLKVEADVILGRATYDWSEHFEADKGKASYAIKASYDAIVRKYRLIFYNDVNNTDCQRKKASAWYRIVNDPEIQITSIGAHEHFLSFPWLVHDILCDIRTNVKREQPSRINVCIGESAINLFHQSSAVLLKSITDKLKFLKDIETAVNKFITAHYNIKNAFLITTYGSTSIYCCEPESDIDICILPKQSKAEKLITVNKEEFFRLPKRDQQIHYLQLIISRAIDSIVSSKKEILGSDVKVPIIKCTSGDMEELNCDISMNEIGLRKTLYITHLYQKDAIYLPLFWFLVKWARISGLVKSLDDTESSIMDTAEFYALIIHILHCPQQKSAELKLPSRWSGIKYLYQKLDQLELNDYHNLGKLIYDFFRISSTLNGNVILEWPSSQIPPVHLDATKVDIFARYAASAFHCLSATRDVSTLQTYCLTTSTTRKEFSKKLSLSISYAIGKAHAFHSAHLSQLTGAVVTIENIPGQLNLFLRGEGTQMAISRLRDEIRSLIQTNKALVLGRLPQKVSRYFMEGSSILIIQKRFDNETQLSFDDSRGPYELLHHASRRNNVYARNVEDLDDEERLTEWKEQQVQRLMSHILKQFQRFPTTNERLKQKLEVTVRFGCYYLVDIQKKLPDSQTSISVKELELATEKGRRVRKAWMRTEFKANYDYDVKKKPEEPQSFHMVELDRPTFSKKVVKKVKERKKNTRKGIATAFTPGLLEFNSRDDSAREHLLQIYRTALTDIGFHKGNVRTRRPPAWKLSLSPSGSYEVQLNLDQNLKLVEVMERCLHWVHATIATGDRLTFNHKIQTNPDIRINISTSDAVKENTDLYRAVIKQTEDGETRVPIEIKDGKPVISRKAAKRAQECLQMVRHCELIEMYTNGSVDCSIAYGNCYSAKDLQLNRPFCEISLYHDPQKLKDMVEKYMDIDILENLVREIVDVTMQLQNAISKRVKNLKD